MLDHLLPTKYEYPVKTVAGRHVAEVVESQRYRDGRHCVNNNVHDTLAIRHWVIGIPERIHFLKLGRPRILSMNMATETLGEEYAKMPNGLAMGFSLVVWIRLWGER